jgi:hypothetical protein
MHIEDNMWFMLLLQECIQFCIQPELLAILPYIEAIEDNEILSVEGLLQVARISDPHNKANFEPLQQAQVVGN